MTTVHAGVKEVALVHYEGCWAALDNQCPHQGGPLGEGSIENGLLRCPWHGFDYDPLTGRLARRFRRQGDLLPARGPRRRRLRRRRAARRARADDLRRDGRDDGQLGRRATSSGWSATPTSASPTRSAARRRPASSTYIGIRHEGAAAFAASAYGKLTGRPAACLTIAGPGATNLLTGLWDAKVDRAPVLALTGQVEEQVLGPGAFQEVDLAAAFDPVAALEPDGAAVLQARRADERSRCKNAIVRRDVAHLIFPDDVQTIAAGDAEAVGARRAAPRRGDRAGRGGARRGARAAREGEAAGDHRRLRRPGEHGRRDRARRAARGAR